MLLLSCTRTRTFGPTPSSVEERAVKISTYQTPGQVLNAYSTLEYDSSGKLTKISDYDASDNLKQYYTYGYNSSNLLSASTFYDSNGNITEYSLYTYDSSQKLTTKTWYDSSGTQTGYESYDYDSSGRPIKDTSYSGTPATISYWDIISYGTNNKVSDRTTYYPGAPTTPEWVMSYTYNSSGKLATADFNGSNCTFNYDSGNNLISMDGPNYQMVMENSPGNSNFSLFDQNNQLNL
jgi:hypothetical protein